MSRPRHSARLRRLGVAAAAGAAGTLALLPELLGGRRTAVADRFPVLDLVAWRPHAGAAALLAAAGLAMRAGTRPAAATVAAVAAAGLVTAGRARRPQRARIEQAAMRGDSTELTVLAANVLSGRADTGELATVIERTAPDFVVLPEAGPDFADKLIGLVDILGYRAWSSTAPGSSDGESVTLLAGSRAGDVRVRAGTALWVPHLEASGGLLGARTLYAVHTAAPMDPWRSRIWRHEFATVARWCRAPVAPLVVGDLNATLDHSALRAALGPRCRSAATDTGHTLVGTFPAALPRWLGIQIDHILIPDDAVTSRFEVIDLAGTDHRAVLATIRIGD